MLAPPDHGRRSQQMQEFHRVSVSPCLAVLVRWLRVPAGCSAVSGTADLEAAA